MSWGLADGSDTNETSTGLARHIAHALAVATAPRYAVAKDPVEVIGDLITIGAHGPGNIAWRALGRLLNNDSTVSDFGHWRAAAVIASGLRSTFNRAETMLLLDQLNPDDVYWRAVLRYCAVGGLQATLDEYLHSLRSSKTDLPLTDDTLYDLAVTARNALSVRPSTLQAFDPSTPETPIKLPGRFALRYGGRGDDQAGSHRQSEVRNAFNSPFWPFVVATTSAGQEGIDFHTWCSAVVHWNTPANPVDFEQREGRVQRFGGHAVRRNVATAHRADALRSNSPDVWKAAYDAARMTSGDLGDFAPYWGVPRSGEGRAPCAPLPAQSRPATTGTAEGRSCLLPARLRSAKAGGHARPHAAQRRDGRRRRATNPRPPTRPRHCLVTGSPSWKSQSVQRMCASSRLVIPEPPP
jgi:hypothetical protein